MNKTRHTIHRKIIALGKKISQSRIADLHQSNHLEEHIIRTSLIDFDYSKQRLNQEGLDYLLQIPDLINVKESLTLLLNGDLINPSENTNVSHTFYRDKNLHTNFEIILSERKKIKKFLQEKKTDRSIKNIICLGIGGSRLGPELLHEYQAFEKNIEIHFCSSLDLFEIKDALTQCSQKETIVIASSKSFETKEILKNLDFVKTWFKSVSNINLENHLYGISSNTSAMSSVGISEKNQFKVLESLGGRFSIWSAMSLPAFVNSDFDSYLEFLEGAKLADDHVLSSSWEKNIPVMMALLSIWNSNALNINNHGIFTYSFRLRSLTRYFSQLSMESNGKSINFKNEKSPFNTTQLIWGGYGIEAQHSTFQWLMQGKIESSCDFIGINDGKHESIDSHEMLLSQVLAMTYGNPNIESPYKSVEGNIPSSIFQLSSLDLKSLGYLIAINEYKVFIESLILGLDPFDQWGVQLGKKLALNSKNNKEFFTSYFSSEILPKS